MATGTQVKVMDRPDASALGEMVNAELAKQIATAKQYPRDADKALNELSALARRSDAVAESCMYTLKRKDKDGSLVFITGPSVRFAELLAYCWGNIRAGARIIEEGQKAVVAQGVAYDLQRNNGLMLEVRRNITTSSGHRFGQDMINVTSNAACSIALRNAIFDCIPEVLWRDVYEEVKAKAVGAAQIPERIQKWVKAFIAKGAKQEDILTAMNVKAIADMGREHLEIFIGLGNALKDGTITADKIFTAEGAEQRERLSLSADDDGDPAHPNNPGTPIDGLLTKAKDDKPPAEKKGGASKKAAPESLGDGGVPAGETESTGKADANAAPAGEGSQPASDDEQEPDTYAEDEAMVTKLEERLDPAKAMTSRKLVDQQRGALNRIAETSPKNLAARAAKILQDWPAK